MKLPPRYEALHRLGQGGGGEVWAVRDRVQGTRCALKVLAKDAGELELVALVREAVALSGLEGLGVPRVLAFGSLEDHRRYMVRELVEGRSLEEIFDQPSAAEWLEPLAQAADQLTALHRAGLLHGDVKPANVIASSRRGTLVDLGLAAPLREGGTLARGLTPKYAAPELLQGEPLTVRAEVYALAATLAEGLARRGSELGDESRMALAKVAARGKDDDPQKRHPSTSELASAMRLAAKLPPHEEAEPAWPVVGIDAFSEKLASAARALERGRLLVVKGDRGSGRTTLLRRVAWTLGIEGRSVVLADKPRTDVTWRDAIALQLAGHAPSQTVIVIDDAETLDEGALALVREAAKGGARVVATAPILEGAKMDLAVPPLDQASAEDLLLRAMPSLPRALVKQLADRSGRKPGVMRAAVRALAGRAVVSEGDIEEALEEAPGHLQNATPEQTLARVERLVEIGQLAQAESQLAAIDFAGSSREMQVRAAIAEARVRTGRGEATLAVSVLEKVMPAADGDAASRAWNVAMSRALLRVGRFQDAVNA
ncbi:MAG TPA: protein kinase, partial [Polyangiaceae bacterium]|nr:protein kinase [Polyangiaceae bacterium]